MSKDPNLVYFYDKEKTMQMVHDIDVADAHEKGIEEGSKQKEIDIAKNMLKDNMPIEIVIKYTGLTKEEISSI